MIDPSGNPFHRERGLGTAFRHLDTTDSTNRQSRLWLAAGAPHGAVLMADHQSAGRGRFARKWESEPGKNLLFTVLLRSGGAGSLVSLAAALSVLEGIQRATGLEGDIKWPNDVRLDGRKVAGILVERISGDVRTAGILVGIGINVNQTCFEPDLEASAISVSLAAGRPVDRAALYHAVLDRFEFNLLQLDSEPGPLLTRYSSRLTGVGDPLTLRTTDESGVIHGRMTGIAPDGGLIVETEQGKQVYHSGDVTIGHALHEEGP